MSKIKIIVNELPQKPEDCPFSYYRDGDWSISCCKPQCTLKKPYCVLCEPTAYRKPCGHLMAYNKNGEVISL